MRRISLKAFMCGLVAASTATAGYFEWARHKVVFDDAYITYRYAQNLLAGHGPIYNLGEHVEGYTNFAWMLLVAAGMRLGADPLEVSRWLGLFSHCGMLFFVGCAGAWLLLEQGYSRLLVALPLLSLLVIPQAFAAMAGSGLETPFVAALLAMAGVLLLYADFSRWQSRAALSLVLSVAVLTRLDCMISVAAAMAALTVSELWAHTQWKRAWRPAFLVALPVGAVVLVWSAWRYRFYGDLLPNTFYAKAASMSHADAGRAYLVALARSYPQILPLAVLSLIGLGSPHPGARRAAWFANLTFAAEIAYTVRVGGDFMEYRFAWHQYGLLVLAASIGLAATSARSLLSGLAVAMTALSVSDQPVKIEADFGMQGLDEMDGFVHVGEAVGRRLGATLPKDTVVSTTLAGTIAYYSKLTVIDQWGLNDRETARQPFVHFIRGHVKWAALGYLHERGVNLYIEHPVICSCSSPCREKRPNVFVRLGDGQCLRTWYMTQKPELTRHVCSHPADFLLNRVDCPKPPKPPTDAPAPGG
jgi:arabinofuranosyltransferase